MPVPKLDPELLKHATPEELAKIETTLRLQLALESPADFADYVTAKLTPNTPYLRPPHVELLSETITALVEGRLLKPDGTPYKKLLVNMPPRHGKSETTTKYTPAWYLSKFPDKRVIAISYGLSLAREFGTKARDLVKQIGPDFGIEVSQSQSAAEDWNLQARQGGMKSAGITGSITGKGADLLIVDDPISNAEDADSELMRNKAWDLYNTTVDSRLQGDKLTIVIQTRWHFDDLTGRLLTVEPDEWFHIFLPAVAGEDDQLGRAPGDALWPEKYNETDFGPIRKRDPRTWASLYQQVPQIGDSAVFNPENYRYWTSTSNAETQLYRLFHKAPDGTLQHTDIPQSKCWRFQTADLAISEKTRADYTVISTWAVTPAHDLLLLDRFRDRIDGTKHQAQFDIEIKKYDPRFTGIESATFGATLIKTLLRLGYRIRELVADKDKETRAWQASSLVNSGRAYFPQGASFLAEWEEELNQFPYGKHDDQVDTFSYAAFILAQYEKRPKRAKKIEAETYDQKVWNHIMKKKNKKKRIIGL